MSVVRFYEKYGFLSYRDPHQEVKKGQRKVVAPPPVARWLQPHEVYLDRTLEELISE